MKVQIKDLQPNPYRNMAHYPIDEAKVEALVASIKQTGFWDNILARKDGMKVQIAYGHHRLAALRKAMKATDAVDIPVRELDDATMLKVMANENMDEWKTSPGVIDETVRAARDFLEKHPDEARKYGQAKSGPTGPNIGAALISGFLGWNKERKEGAWNPDRIKYAIERLGLIDEGKLDAEVVRELPTERSARDFVKAVKQLNPNKEQQKKAAKEISAMAKGERGEAAVRWAVSDQVFPSKKKKDKERDPKLYDLRLVIKDATEHATKLGSQVLTLIKFHNEVSESVYWQEMTGFILAVRSLGADLKKFENTVKEKGEKSNVKRLKG